MTPCKHCNTRGWKWVDNRWVPCDVCVGCGYTRPERQAA